jgi:hypothetical protein
MLIDVGCVYDDRLPTLVGGLERDYLK